MEWRHDTQHNDVQPDDTQLRRPNSIATLGNKLLYDDCRLGECRHAERHLLNVVMLSVVLMNVVYAKCHYLLLD